MSNVEPDPLAPGDTLLVPGGIQPPVVEVPVVPVPTQPEGFVSQKEFEERMAKARQEEKDKLYGRLSTMEDELKKVREEREAETKAQKAARLAAEAEAKAKAEDEMTAKDLLAQKEQEWNSRFESLQADRERDLAVIDMERRLNQIETYKAHRLTEVADEIMPELRDLVAGSSEEEIENSIATAINKTNAILANVTAHRQQERQQQRGASVTAPPVGPLENDASYETITADDIRNMDMATYAKNRQKLMQAASQRNR